MPLFQKGENKIRRPAAARDAVGHAVVDSQPATHKAATSKEEGKEEGSKSSTQKLTQRQKNRSKALSATEGPADNGTTGLSLRQHALLNALLVQPTYRAAAAAAGISIGTCMNYLALPLFQASLRAAREKQRAEIAGGFANLAEPALAVIRRALGCEDPMVALKAADMVIKRLIPESKEAQHQEGLPEMRITEIIVELKQPASDTHTVIQGELAGNRGGTSNRGDTSGESAEAGGNSPAGVPGAAGMEGIAIQSNEGSDAGWGSLAIVVEGEGKRPPPEGWGL